MPVVTWAGGRRWWLQMDLPAEGVGAAQSTGQPVPADTALRNVRAWPQARSLARVLGKQGA